MRNVFQFLLLISLVWFSSCKKGESTIDIEGEWAIKSMTCLDCKTVVTNGVEESIINFIVTGKDFNAKVAFEDGLSSSTGTFTATLQGTIDGSSFYREQPLTPFGLTGNYFRNGNQIVTKINNGETVILIISDETDNDFTITYKENSTIELYNASQPITAPSGSQTTTGTYIYKLERL